MCKGIRQTVCAACVLGTALAGLGTAATAEQYLRVEVDGPLTPEAKAALARVLAAPAQSSSASTLDATVLMDGAAFEPLSLETFCQRGLCEGAPVSLAPPDVPSGPPGNGTRGLSIDPSLLREFQPDRSVRRSQPGDVDTPVLRVPSPAPVIGPPVLPGVGPTRDLMVLEPRNPLRELLADRLDGAGIAGDQTALIPLPPDYAELNPAFSDGLPDATATPALGNIVVNAPAAAELARLERDLEDYGSTSRTVPWQGAALDAEIAAELAAYGVTLEPIMVAAEPGGEEFPDTPPGAVQNRVVANLDDIREVDIDWAKVVGQSDPASSAAGAGTASDACAVGPHWPQDVVTVAGRIDLALEVIEAMGQAHPRRSNVLVIDSGVSEAAARRLGRALYVDTTKLLSPASYIRGTRISEPKCDFVDPWRTDLAFGYAPEADDRVKHECTYEEPLRYLAPPEAPDPPGSYRPEHGSYVGALAAGGDLLKHASGADRLVGVSFARIMWSRGEGAAISSEVTDVGRAFDYAIRRGVDVVNASLAIRGGDDDILQQKITEYMQGGGLVVAAAGNFGAELRQESPAFPASMASPGTEDRMIVVAGLRPNDMDVEFWPNSAHSSELVDIAAPAERVASMGVDGESLCMSGTSASAPQVSFVAGALKALGLRSAAEVKRRILATADLRSDLLGDEVRDGRVLNAARALDVFVDLVWVDDEPEPRRVHVLSDEDAGPGLSMRACADTFEQLARGRVDLGRLLSWRRLDDGKAEVWFRTGGSPALSAIDSTCEVPGADPSDMWHLVDPATGSVEDVAFERIARIVPSRFRSALPDAQALMSLQ